MLVSSVRLWSLAPSVFLPALVYEVGNGAIAPVIALTALQLGASTAQAGLILTLLGVGQIFGNVPSSFLVNRLGDRRAMMVAAGVATAALLTCFVAPNLLAFGPAVAVIGMCNATYYLGRQHYIISEEHVVRYFSDGSQKDLGSRKSVIGEARCPFRIPIKAVCI